MTKKHEENEQTQSPLRKMMSDAKGGEYVSIKNLEEAKKVKNSYLVMEGDDGGQIYITCPVELVKCEEKQLRELLESLDDLVWQDLSMTGLYYEIHEPDSIVSGGSGGGKAGDDLWIHSEFDNIKNKIKEVINGKRKKI